MSNRTDHQRWLVAELFRGIEQAHDSRVCKSNSDRAFHLIGYLEAIAGFTPEEEARFDDLLFQRRVRIGDTYRTGEGHGEWTVYAITDGVAAIQDTFDGRCATKPCADLVKLELVGRKS